MIEKQVVLIYFERPTIHYDILKVVHSESPPGPHKTP